MQIVGPPGGLTVVTAGDPLRVPVEPARGNVKNAHALVHHLAGARDRLAQKAAIIKDGFVYPVKDHEFSPEPAAPAVDLHEDLIVRNVVKTVNIQKDSQLSLKVLHGVFLESGAAAAPAGGHKGIVLSCGGIDDIVFFAVFFLLRDAQELFIVRT